MEHSRRDFLRKSSLLGLAGLGMTAVASGLDTMAALAQDQEKAVNFTLPQLPYKTDALEPHIDKMTMEIHHTKHHQAYVTNLNKVCQENGIEGTLEELLNNVSKHPAAVRNNGGGHWNHSFFWKLMKAPKGDNTPPGKVADALKSAFGSIDDFKKQLNDAGLKRFGSGWAWLVKTPEGKLIIGSTPNQDNPLMDVTESRGTPLLGIDVWEHAYYLKYQNKRADYLTAWWNVVNWEEVAGKI